MPSFPLRLFASSSAAFALVFSAACAKRPEPQASAAPASGLCAPIAFPELKFERPVFFTAVPGTGRVCVVEQKGCVWTFQNDPATLPGQRQLAADLTDVVLALGNKAHPGANEEGLLGLAFHPKFADNRTLFLHYSLDVPRSAGGPKQRRNRVARFVLKADGTVDRASETIVLEVDQPEANHNGGMLAFGPDGMLYIGLGDGGGAGDKHGALGNGQKTDTWLGKILRVDVDHLNKAGATYAVPADNPFVGRPGFAPEIWALGLRNPWRFSFDRQTGDLWCGDVGQNAHEEIDLITRGANCGWRVREGKFPFAEKEQPAVLPLLEPLVDHERKDALSITGGHVYRGKNIPALDGWYVYGDFVTGNLWRLKREPNGAVRGPELLSFTLKTLASFGEDGAGEIHMCCFDGRIYRLAGK